MKTTNFEYFECQKPLFFICNFQHFIVEELLKKVSKSIPLFGSKYVGMSTWQMILFNDKVHLKS
jgi:hypothetical protein